MIELQRPLCFIDLETTGTNKAEDRIVEISILKYMPDGEYQTRSRRVNPGIPIPVGATETHGISDEDVKDCPTFKQVASSILDYIKGCDIAGYNSNAFDLPLLYMEVCRAGLTWEYKSSLFIDVANIFKRKEERTLSAAVRFYLNKDHEEAHSAAGDVLATLEVLEAQLKRYEDIPTTLPELALYSNYDRELIDINGCFKKDEQGEYRFAFGKHENKLCKNELGYLNWMLNADFLPDAKAIAQQIILS